jgi:oxysterol-binding protein-related protein 9/10/11
LYLQCNWDVTEAAPPIPSIRPKTGTSSAASSIKSSKASVLSRTPSPTTLPNTKLENPIRVSYLTEQTSHHPPVSAFYVDCPEKGISARGFDQLSAKFTGTSIKVTAGEHNLGIFITLHKRDDEQYQLTHPAAHLGGLLRGSLSVTVGDQCYVTCPKTKLKTILHYQEEGWLGKTQNKVEGIVFHYDPENDDKVRLRDVPEKDIVARLSGNWRERTYFSLGLKPIVSPSPFLLLAPSHTTFLRSRKTKPSSSTSSLYRCIPK